MKSGLPDFVLPFLAEGKRQKANMEVLLLRPKAQWRKSKAKHFCRLPVTGNPGNR